MRNGFTLTGLLLLLVTTGCNQISRYPDHIELIAAKYDIYQDLMLNRQASANRCRINFQPADDLQPTDAQLGAQGSEPNRRQDASDWLNALRDAGGDDTPPATEAAPSSSPPTTSPTSTLFGDDAPDASPAGGANPASPTGGANPASPTASTPPASPTGSISAPSESGLAGASSPGSIEDNDYYSVSILTQDRPYYTQINLPSPNSTSATLVVPAKAQLNMKATPNNASPISYDNVDVEITYFLSKTPNGVWACLDRDVRITSRLQVPDDQEEEPPSRPIPRW